MRLRGVAASSAAGVLAASMLAAAPLARAFVVAPPARSASGLLSRDAATLLARRVNAASVGSRRPSATSMAVAGPGDATKVVVCGPRDGIAGLVASRLSAAGGARKVLLADETELLQDQLAGAKVVVASSDGGPGADEAPPGLTDEIVSALPSSTEYLVWVDSPEGRTAARLAKAELGVIGGLFGGGFKESLEAVRSVEGDVKCVVVHAGRLFGASGGEEAVPFLTGPKAEPVLDESITRQAVLVGPGTVLSSPKEAATKRSSVAEAIERFLDGPERRRGVELSVVSVEGFATTDEEWQEELKRLDDSEGVAVFSIDFESIEKKDQLMNWLAESWGPTALRKSTAGMLRSGARPVAASPTPQGVELLWETLTEDLTAVQAGKLSVTVNEEPAGIRVVRMAGAGQPQGKALSGEEEIVQNLIEGINTVAYPKALVKRKAPKVSRAAAAEAMAAAGASAPAAGATALPPAVEEGAAGAVLAAPAGAVLAAPAAAMAAPVKEAVGEEEGKGEAVPAPAEKPEVAAAPAAAAPRKGRGRRSGGKRKSS